MRKIKLTIAGFLKIFSVHKNLKVFLLLSLPFLTQLSCNTTEPPLVIPPKDPRTYTWTIDTLINNSFQTAMRRIWGCAPNDVYIGGHNADTPGCLWHYNGESWEPVNLPVITFDVNGIYGFSSNDVWVVGETATDFSLILHFNGTNWQNYSNSTGKALRCIWGSSPSNIWAAGTNTLFHFNGSSWNNSSFFIPSQGVHILSMSGLNSNDIYMVGGRNDVVQPLDTSFYYLYQFDGSQWTVVDSSYITNNDNVRNFGVQLKTIGGELYSASDRLFKKEGNKWEIINDDPLIFSLGGSSSNNIFGAGINATVYHFNGSDWKEITIKEGFQEPIYDIWTDGTEAFMVAMDGIRTFVIHGK
ncbi:MAG TPA: hypothetical protein DHV28_11870 [Ignavibacteriales bacterium]|nr:hypothetical protein [Ignavibacteriales bacterium]